MGGRNIFYSDSGLVISSSFSLVEDLLKTDPMDLDPYKVLEYLAVRHVLYPAWLGHSTEHKRIKWLLPYEYLVVDAETSSFRVNSILYSLENEKQSDRSKLSGDLLSILKRIIWRPEFEDATVAASLSGGRDSRLIAGVASDFYHKIRYRIAYAQGHFDSSKDMKVSSKLARIQGIPLDVYRFQPDRDEDRFYELTEAFTPTFNNKLAPLLDDVGTYSLGLGGIFGTELFMPIPWESIDEYVQTKIGLAKQYLKVEDDFWETFRDALNGEFRGIKDHFRLSDGNDQDYIRLFILLVTARYGSHIISAFNQSGFQLEPYGSYAILELALRVPPGFWGNHRRFGGDAKIQQGAMAELNSRMARVLTYKNYRPMMPLSVAAFPLYIKGVILQAGDFLRRRLDKTRKELTRVEFPGGYYLSNGWESNFLDRARKKYGFASRQEVDSRGMAVS